MKQCSWCAGWIIKPWTTCGRKWFCCLSCFTEWLLEKARERRQREALQEKEEM